MRSPALLLPASLLAGVASAQVTFVEIGTVDLDGTANPANAEFVGSNPSAVAWDGFDLFVAGFNSSGATADVGIVRIGDALTSPDFGAAFGVLSTPNLRGYSGLDVGDPGLAAAYDDGGADPNGIAVYVTPGGGAGVQVWQKTARGGSGVGLDPGFPGGNPAMGSGVGWTTFGSGRRALQDAASGMDIWTTSDGMIILTSEGTFWRDMDYDDATGDVWLREGNNLIHWERTGDNAVANGTVVFDPADSDFVNGQNVAFVGAASGDLVIFNDRSSTAGGQDFFGVVRVVRPDGTPVTVDWSGFAPSTGVGYYDFSWDPDTGTLAILDFANRNAHVFAVDPEIGTSYCGPAVPNSTGASGTIAAVGSDVAASNSVALVASNLPNNSFGYFLTSQMQGLAMNPGGSSGNLCLGGMIGRYVGAGQVQNSGSAGGFSLVLDLTATPTPTGFVTVQAGDTWNFTTWHRDALMGTATSNFTDAVSVTFQ